MWKKFCRWYLYRHLGWKTNVTVNHPEKFIICLAPHTSNWDFILGQLYAGAEGLHTNFLMKKEWFFWPLGPLFRRLGGIPVFRDRHTSMTDNLANTAKQSGSFRLCVTPEGARSTLIGKRDSITLRLKLRFLFSFMASILRKSS